VNPSVRSSSGNGDITPERPFVAKTLRRHLRELRGNHGQAFPEEEITSANTRKPERIQDWLEETDAQGGLQYAIFELVRPATQAYDQAVDAIAGRYCSQVTRERITLDIRSLM
jgi:hypothetical protein